jgi:UMF1 family MFS transporter
MEAEGGEIKEPKTASGDDDTPLTGVMACPGPFKWCFNRFRLQTNDANGWMFNNFGGNVATMSNIFLATAIIYLARTDIGCEEVGSTCSTVYGFKPSSLITLVATASGIMSAFLLPYIGAIVDYTPKRKLLGIVSTITFIIIQAVQIGISQNTWFIMTILQAFNGFFYQVNEMCILAYLPEIDEQLNDERKFTWYNTLFTIFGTFFQVLYIIVLIGVSGVLQYNDAQIGRLGQIFAVIFGGIPWYVGWSFFEEKEAKRPLEEGSSLATAGFKQIFNTTKGLFQEYPRTVGLYFLGVVFVDAAVESSLAISVTYFSVILEFDARVIGILFIITLCSSMLGAVAMFWLTRRLNPMTTLKLTLVMSILANFGVYFTLTDPSRRNLAFGAGFIWGLIAGVYYPLYRVIYALIVPADQEAELAGFFRYCGQILAWCPPLVFTVINESGYNFKYGAVSTNAFFVIGIAIFTFMKPWDQCLEDAKVNKMGQEAKSQFDEFEEA